MKFGEVKPAELDDYRLALINENKDDLCWIKGNNTHLQAIFYGFKELLVRQKTFAGMLLGEHKLDIGRYKIFDMEIRHRGLKHRTILAHNAVVMNVLSRDITKAKLKYLNQLRKERRLAAKQNRN